jgi:SAM-dependent methyltransferase
MLQRIDDQELPLLFYSALTLLPAALLVTHPTYTTDPFSDPLTIVDFGCGTGRATMHMAYAIIQYKKNNPAFTRSVHIVGLDASEEMLNLAREKLPVFEAPWGQFGIVITFQQWNPYTFKLNKYRNKDLGEERVCWRADMVISTLVMEHFPLNSFMFTIDHFFQGETSGSGRVDNISFGGILVLTNLHWEVGGLTVAHFTDMETGIRYQAEENTARFNHQQADFNDALMFSGFFEASGIGFKERMVNDRLLQSHILGERARKYLGKNIWWGGAYMKTKDWKRVHDYNGNFLEVSPEEMKELEQQIKDNDIWLNNPPPRVKGDST